MRSVLIMTLNTLKVTFRKKRNIIIYLIIPIAITLASLSMYSKDNTIVNLGIVNKDESKLSLDFVNSLMKNDKFKISSINETEIDRKLTSRELDCVLAIPGNFSSGIYNRTLKNINIISIKGEESTAWIKSYTNFYIENLMNISEASEGNLNTFNSIYEGFKSQKLTLQAQSVQDETQSKNATSQSIGFLIMFMLMGSVNTANLMLKEKKNRTYFRICSSPVTSKAYIMANVISNILMMFIQITVVILVATKILKINTFVPFGELLTILMSFALASVGLGVLFAAVSKSTNQASILSTLIITPSCMIGGCFWPSYVMPQSMQKIAAFLPQKWTLDAISKLQTGSSFRDVYMNIAIILAFALAFFLIAAYKFKNNDDVKNFV